MIVREILGNTASCNLGHAQPDYLPLEWFETTKRIVRKETFSGREIAVKLWQEGLRLQEGDILAHDEAFAIVVTIIPCEAIVLTPQNLIDMGTVCYEIGNKHLPLFIQDNQVLIPYEAPLFRLMEAAGFNPRQEKRKLLNMLKANVQPHGHEQPNENRESLFTRILNLTSKA